METWMILHCLQRQGVSGFSRTRVKKYVYAKFNVYRSYNATRAGEAT